MATKRPFEEIAADFTSVGVVNWTSEAHELPVRSNTSDPAPTPVPIKRFPSRDNAIAVISTPPTDRGVDPVWRVHNVVARDVLAYTCMRQAFVVDDSTTANVSPSPAIATFWPKRRIPVSP